MRQITTLSLDDARTLVNHILGIALADGLSPVCVVACDIAGNPLYLVTMDGCPPASITVALNKGYTVIRSGGKPTMVYAQRQADGSFDPANWTDSRLTAFGGGVPVISPHDGSVVGAIGVSGRKPEEDEELASQRPDGWTA